MIKTVSILLTFLTVISIIATYKGTGLYGVTSSTKSASVRSTSTYSSSTTSGWSSGK